MYGEAGQLLAFSQGLPQYAVAPVSHPTPPTPHGEELLSGFHADLTSGEPHMGNLVQISSVSEYDLGGEGDLFKAPEPIIEEPVLELDPVAAAISMMAGGEDVVSAGTMKVTNVEPIQSDLFSEVLYECEKDLLAKSAIAEFSSEVGDLKRPAMQMEETPVVEQSSLVAEGPIQKSVSFGSLNSMEWLKACTMRSDFLNFQGLDLGAAFRLRRAYSEGDIQTLGNGNFSLGNTSVVHPSLDIGDRKVDNKIEERRQKLSRYWKKKTQRNFGRKIKYACRKALADSQPRIRGRFAKTEECEAARPLK